MFERNLLLRNGLYSGNIFEDNDWAILERARPLNKTNINNMNESKDYFELGRGAKLVPNEYYWHQYVLGIDLSLSKRQFIAMEVGKNKVLYRKELGLDELVQSEWIELLELSKTKAMIQNLHQDTSSKENSLTDFHESMSEIISKKELIKGNWTSIDEYNNLKHNSNFGKWVDATPIKGRLKFGLDLKKESENCRVDIAVYYHTMGNGYYSIVFGTFQLGYNQILVWQNNIFPITIAYELKENTLTLDLFDKKITFGKDEMPT